MTMDPTAATTTTTTAAAAAASIRMMHDNENNNDRNEDLRVYAGFTSSVSDMHADEEDCCALAACGICLQARNEYMLRHHHPSNNNNNTMTNNNNNTTMTHTNTTGYVPEPMWRIVGRYALLYGAVLVLFLWSGASLSTNRTNDADDSHNDNNDDGVTNSDPVMSLVPFIIGITILAIARCSSRNKAVLFRRELRHKMLERTNGAVVHNIQFEANDWRVHNRYGCYCYSPEEYSRVRLVSQPNRGGVDFCTKIWNAVSDLCCGVCCSCWCQCCGMCAIAQENRMLKKLVPPQAFRIDFITYQSWDEYAPKLQALRDNSVMSMAAHFSASNLSKLSVMLLKYTLGILCVLAVVAFTAFDNAFKWQNMLVLLGTLGQAVTVLFAVHWYYCRLDLSLDAVIKYFASGFLFATSMAMVFEMIISVFLQFILGILMVIMEYGYISSTATQTNNENSDSKGPTISDISKEFASDYPWIMGLYLFMSAFVVAAMVEELCKYFGFKMLRHPDLERDTLDTKGNDIYEEEDSNLLSSRVSRSSHSTIPSLKSRGAAITVAMVSAAAGFACCENLVYVFSYSGGSLQSEVGVLIARSFFPVHPIAAAIQSINVVRSDVEGEPGIKVGRIILPAVILHGSFDFTLMLLGFLGNRNSDEDSDSSTDDKSTENEEIGLLSLFLSVMIVIIGLTYYFCTARKQRRRLENSESTVGMRLIEGSII